DAVGSEQMVVTERRRNPARAELIVFKPGLDVVAAVPGGLEAVNPYHLIFGQTRRGHHLRVSAFEFDVALWWAPAAPPFSARRDRSASAAPYKPEAASARNHRARLARRAPAWKTEAAACRRSKTSRRWRRPHTLRGLCCIPRAPGDIPPSPRRTRAGWRTALRRALRRVHHPPKQPGTEAMLRSARQRLRPDILCAF